MHRRHALALGGLLPFAAAAQSAEWPSQPVRMVVPFAAGGPTDVPARVVTEEMSRALPQRVIVENRTGSGIVIGTDVVAKAAKDGQTLLYTTIGHAVVRALFDRVPFDPVRDFAPVALVGQIPMVMMVHNSFPARTLPEVIAYLRANPGRVDYASSGNGGALHLATELFLSQAGNLQANHVAFRGSAQAMPDVLAGRVPLMVDVAASALPFIQRGEMRAIAIATRERSAIAPNIPTFIEQGLAGFEAYTWHMVMAPAGTPPATLRAVNAAVNRALAVENVRTRLTELAMQVVGDSTPESAAAFLNAEIAKWEPIIRQKGIKAD
ncbi:Bug family tripartite tricarboxylate transporter substrate binding protein [Roseococcus sp. DSY-14]|uniref:Bug family tripartite tricarboxylate transporter substrate binding protein n=1 Tax=Roseococcus sp. DSY-14 TaxID=3369650 RepID=UPI00387B4AFB